MPTEASTRDPATTAGEQSPMRTDSARLPAPGDIVRLDAAASAEYARQPFHLLLTETPAASSIDAAEGRPAETARWVLVSGWQLDEYGQQIVLRANLPARREALAAVPRPTRTKRHRAA